MNRRERINDPLDAIKAAMGGHQAGVWTALPGIVQSFDAVTMTAEVQPAVQGTQIAKDGSQKNINYPLLLDVPVVLMGAGGVTLTVPVKAMDEGLLVFSSRAIDAWHQSGGVQPQAEQRLHDMSDGFIIVGLRSAPRALANYNTTCAELRDDPGQTFIRLDPTAQAITITAPGGLFINAKVTQVGDTDQTGAITASGEGTFNGGHTVSAHDHGNVQNGGGTTAKPQG
jgi:Phage protein Gp138 N-terminal domain